MHVMTFLKPIGIYLCFNPCTIIFYSSLKLKLWLKWFFTRKILYFFLSYFITFEIFCFKIPFCIEVSFYKVLKILTSYNIYFSFCCKRFKCLDTKKWIVFTNHLIYIMDYFYHYHHNYLTGFFCLLFISIKIIIIYHSVY